MKLFNSEFIVEYRHSGLGGRGGLKLVHVKARTPDKAMKKVEKNGLGFRVPLRAWKV